MVDGASGEILELLATADLALPPTAIAVNLERRGVDVSRRTVQRRLAELRDQGLVEKALDEKGYYRTTERGRAFVADE
ncbi:MAG: winged-helix domain-containing protein [Haloarculaceae archaeon]